MYVDYNMHNPSQNSPRIVIIALILLFIIQYALSISINVEVSKINLLLSYIIIMIYVLKNYSRTHSLIVFLSFYGIFILGHLMLDILFDIPLRQATKWNNYLLSESTYLTINSSYTLSLIGILLGTTYKLRIRNPVKQANKKNILKVVRFLIIVLAPLAIYKLYYDFIQISSGGHYLLYSGLQRSSFVVRIGWYAVQMLLPILLINVKTKKQFYNYILLYAAINLFAFMRGSRFLFLIPLIYFAWFYYKFISTKSINIMYLVMFVITLFSLSSLSNYYSKRTTSIRTDMLFSTLDLGGSYYIHAYYIDYYDRIDNPSRLLIFGPITDYIQRLYDDDIRGHNVERVRKSYSLDHKLTYAVSQNAYLQGRGLGGNFVTEFYAAFGLPSVFIFSIILGIVIIHMERAFMVSDTFKIISWYWIGSLIFMPRSDTLAFVMSSLITLLLYSVIKMFVNLIQDKSQKAIS